MTEPHGVSSIRDSSSSEIESLLHTCPRWKCGNPKLGSHLMTSKQTAAIDLPMKAIAWKDDKGQVWIAYNDPMYIARRHGIEDRPEQLKKMSGALAKLTSKAAGK